METIPLWKNTEKLSIQQFCEKYLTRQRYYGRKTAPTPRELSTDAVLVQNHIAPTFVKGKKRKVTITEQHCKLLKEEHGGGLLGSYTGIKRKKTEKRSVSYRHTPRYSQQDIERVESTFGAVLSGTTKIGLYGADQSDCGSLFEPSTTGGLEWSLNGMSSNLKRAVDRTTDDDDESINPISGVKGIDNLVYFGRVNTVSPPHTEELDLFSINYLVWGHPKIWYFCPADYLEQVYQVLGDLCQG